MFWRVSEKKKSGFAIFFHLFFPIFPCPLFKRRWKKIFNRNREFCCGCNNNTNLYTNVIFWQFEVVLITRSLSHTHTSLLIRLFASLSGNFLLCQLTLFLMILLGRMEATCGWRFASTNHTFTCFNSTHTHTHANITKLFAFISTNMRTSLSWFCSRVSYLTTDG